MLRFGRGIVKSRHVILIVGLILLIPSIFGYLGTRINYDVLYYLPDDIETMQGQEILMDDYGKGAYALFVAEGLSDADAAKLKSCLEEVEHVEEIIWYDSIADNSIPQEILPSDIYDVYHKENSTLMAIFFDTGTSEDATMDAIDEIRDIAGDQCYLSSMSAIVTDTKHMVEKELFWYVLVAVLLSVLVLALTMDSWMAPILFLTNIGMAIIYNLGTNFIKGEISFITMALAAVLQLGVTMDYSIFMWHSYREQKTLCEDKNEAMARAISMTITSVAGSSLTTIAGFIALCFMTFTLGSDLGIVMAKGVVLGVVGCVTILPSLILVFDKAIEKTTHKTASLNPHGLVDGLVKHKKLLAIIMLILWIPAIYGYSTMDVYYNLDSSLPEYLPCVQANEVLKEDYDMSTVHMILASDDLSSKDEINMLNQIENVKGVKLAAGTASILDGTIPTEFIPGSTTQALSSGNTHLMLVMSEYPVASDEVNQQIDIIESIVKAYDPDAMVIGEAPCTKDLIEITDKDFKVVSAISILAIFLIILFVLKNAVLPFLLVFVIELAIYINLATSSYIGTTLPFIASIVIGTIQLGATVDYAILMTNRYLHERGLGRDKVDAAKEAVGASMPSIITSALGFFAATIGVGIYSDVDLIGSLCYLMARGAIISMIAVLVFLPSLYLIFDRLIIKADFGEARKSRIKKIREKVADRVGNIKGEASENEEK